MQLLLDSGEKKGRKRKKRKRKERNIRKKKIKSMEKGRKDKFLPSLGSPQGFL